LSLIISHWLEYPRVELDKNTFNTPSINQH